MKKQLFILRIVIVNIVFCLIPLFATEKYLQKTISSLDTTLILPRVSKDHYYKNYDELNRQFHKGLTLKRFQYAPLPPQIRHLFESKLNALSQPTSKQVQELIATHVLPTIQAIINSTENLKVRQAQLTEREEKVTFAQVKGKSDSLTQDQLNTILNTSYIFIPYIKESYTVLSTPKKKEAAFVNKAIATLSGGVFWYHIDYDQKKTTAIHLDNTVQSESKYEINILRHFSDKNYSKAIINNAIYAAEKKAFQQLVSDLALQTRHIKSFKLTDQIVEAYNNHYSIHIGKRENIELDDTFYMYEWITNDKKRSATQVGFGYITKVGNNVSYPDQKSIFMQQLGGLQSIGGWIEEDPRQKIAIRMTPFYQTGLSIKKESIMIKSQNGYYFTLLNKDYDTAFGLGLSGVYNIAHYTGVSQLFGDISFKGSVLSDSTGQSPDSTNTISTTPLLYSAYAGIRKKFWRKSQSIMVRSAIGYDGIYLLTSGDNISNIDIQTFGIELEIGYEKLFSSHASFFITISKKWTLSSAEFNYTYHDSTVNEVQSIDNFSLGGVIISSGVEFQF